MSTKVGLTKILSSKSHIRARSSFIQPSFIHMGKGPILILIGQKKCQEFKGTFGWKLEEDIPILMRLCEFQDARKRNFVKKLKNFFKKVRFA